MTDKMRAIRDRAILTSKQRSKPITSVADEQAGDVCTAVEKNAQANQAAMASMLSGVDDAARVQAINHLQQQQGNAFVQRVLNDSDEETQQEFLGNTGNVLDLSQKALDVGEKGVLSDMPGMGIVFDALSEMSGRGSGGENISETIGGGLTKAVGSGLGLQKGPKSALEGIARNKGLSGVLGIFGDVLKLAGGKQQGPEIGLADVGEYVDVGSKLLNPKELVQQGITEGFGGLHDLFQGGASWLATGSTEKLSKLREKQLKGEGGSITQGYSMIASTLGSMLTGDHKDINLISDLSKAGKLGSLPKLGSHLGNEWADLTHRPGGFGATMKEVGSFIWKGKQGKGGIKAVGTSVANAASSIWDQLIN